MNGFEVILPFVLGKFIPEDERILVIDDTSEIRIEHNNAVRLEARQAQNGLPAVTICELLKAALRHHPDRIILGEIRGKEAYELLQTLNTGQSGSLSTLHAPSPKQALSRFANCGRSDTTALSYMSPARNRGSPHDEVMCGELCASPSATGCERNARWYAGTMPKKSCAESRITPPRKSAIQLIRTVERTERPSRFKW